MTFRLGFASFAANYSSVISAAADYGMLSLQELIKHNNVKRRLFFKGL